MHHRGPTKLLDQAVLAVQHVLRMRAPPKLIALSSPWESSPKCSHAIMDGSWSSLSMAPIEPSLVGDEVVAQEEDIEDMAVIGAVLRSDGEGCSPSLEVSGGKDGDLL